MLLTGAELSSQIKPPDKNENVAVLPLLWDAVNFERRGDWVSARRGEHQINPGEVRAGLCVGIYKKVANSGQAFGEIFAARCVST